MRGWLRVLASLVVGAGGAQASASFVYYTFVPAAVQSNGDFAIDLYVSLTLGDDWNAADLYVTTYGAVTIADPLDNSDGAWVPPFPDTGATYDTYLRSPSAAMARPLLGYPAQVTSTYFSVQWLDVVGTNSPPSFKAARIALDGTGNYPSINAVGIGNPLISITVSSYVYLSEFLVRGDYALYDGVPEPASAMSWILGVALLGMPRRIR